MAKKKSVRLYVPSIGAKLKLARDWDFTLFLERRNSALAEYFYPDVEIKWSYNTALASVPVTLPAGTSLTVSRIYIRSGKGEFDSITFIATGLPKKPHVKGKSLRFWAKLADVNNIEFEPQEEPATV